VKVLSRSSPSEAGLSLSSCLTQELDPGLLPLSPSSSYNLMHSDTSVILTEKPKEEKKMATAPPPSVNNCKEAAHPLDATELVVNDKKVIDNLFLEL